MRVLLVHPEDSPKLGPWSRERWDLIVDLGKSSAFSAAAWAQQYGCPVLRTDSFREGTADVRRVQKIFSAGRGRLLDREGIDWWDLTSLLIAPEAMTVLAFQRMASEINPSAELRATRSGGPARLFAALVGRDLSSFADTSVARWGGRAQHYAEFVRRFSVAQIREILLDKYDPAYRWRSRFTARRASSHDPVVLVPSAYGNVSRTAAAYAQLIPQQAFLVATTRRSGRQFVPPPNVKLCELAAYAQGDPPQAEIASLLEQWAHLWKDLRAVPELQVLSRAGVLDPLSEWVRSGLSVRNAWRDLIEREPICGVLCGDDSNRYTVLPVLLAARRKIPTVDLHHGAFDGRYLLKDLPCDVYLAKNEMERDYLVRVCNLPADRIVLGAPASTHVASSGSREQPRRTSAIFFSEPYEVVGMRGEEVYRELLPPLCRLAREQGHGMIVKLHPFESRAQRSRILRDCISPEDGKLVSIVDGPPTAELLSQAWFGITVESSSVLDCVQNGVQCFLCGWLTLSPYEYVQQYARFGVGEVLQSVEEVRRIPERIADFHNRPAGQEHLSRAVDPVMLHRLLTSSLRQESGSRVTS